MTAYVGKNLYLAFGGTVLSSDYRVFEPSEEMGLEDGSAGADLAKTFLSTLKDGKASLTMRSISGTAGTAKWVGLAPGIEGTLEWGPEGTASGKIKNSVNAILQSKASSEAYAGVTEWKYEFQYSGVVTPSTY